MTLGQFNKIGALVHTHEQTEQPAKKKKKKRINNKQVSQSPGSPLKFLYVLSEDKDIFKSDEHFYPSSKIETK